MHKPSQARIDPQSYSRSRGLTVVELLLVMGVIGVLAAIAIPSYRNYVLKGQIAQAEMDITQIEGAIANYETGNTGVPPVSLAAINLSYKLDPWGNPYYYLSYATVNGVGKLRKDKSLHPLNSDYDLYSAGPDGQTKLPLTASVSQDDIIRANDGQFVGVAANY